MKRIAVALALLLITGCAPLMQKFPIGENAKKYQEAKTEFKQGHYKQAYELYRALADKDSDSHWAELSKYNAALVLVHYKNPDKNYFQAEREFDEFLIRYPSSQFLDDAGSWLEALKNFDQSRTGELLKEIDSITKKFTESVTRQEDLQKQKDAVVKERDVLTVEKSNLLKKVDDLLGDKALLLQEKSALLKERDGLSKDKASLEKRVDALTRDKAALILAKEKLEKSLRDLTMVDVKMEKKRRKIK